MSKEKKAQIIDSLQDVFSKCSIGILTDYRGLATPEMTDLRRRLQRSGSEYKVVKNTLARFAAERAGKGGATALDVGHGQGVVATGWYALAAVGATGTDAQPPG